MKRLDAPAVPKMITPSILKCSELFSESDDSEIVNFIESSGQVDLETGELLSSFHKATDSLFLVISGRLEASYQINEGFNDKVVIDLFHPGEIIGAMSLLSEFNRSDSIRAVEPTHLIALAKETFFENQLMFPNIFKKFMGMFEERMRRERVADFLGRFYPDFDFNMLQTMQERVTWRSLKAGENLFQQGDLDHTVYFVASGRLNITRTYPSQGERFLTAVTHGDLVGEFSMFNRKPRSATVTAMRDSDLICITKADFNELIAADSKAGLALMQLIVERVQLINESLDNPPLVAEKNIAVVPLSLSLDLENFTQQLSISLGRLATQKILSRNQFISEFGLLNAAQITFGDEAFNSIIAAWLNEQEKKHDFMVYVTDPIDTKWTQRCVRQADRILFLADATTAPALTAVETAINKLKIFGQKEIVLLHPESTNTPSGTALWLSSRSLSAHYHIQDNNALHYDRLARRLTGKAVGVVYSGGGARGFAHLGVWQAIQELDIPVDFIGGTSMGSVMAAASCEGWGVETVRGIAREMSNPKALFDYTLPLTSIMSSAKLTRFCKKVFGQRQIEDFWVPFFCMATNATTAEPEVIRSGPVWRAIRKSIAIPGVFSPVIENGDVILDGGVMNNFPVDIMRDMAQSNVVIGVNVAPYQEKKRDYDFETEISGWHLVWSRINPFKKRLKSPSLIGTILRALELNSVHLGKRLKFDEGLLIEADVKSVGVLDFSNYEKAIKIGYEESHEQLKKWWLGSLST